MVLERIAGGNYATFCSRLGSRVQMSMRRGFYGLSMWLAGFDVDVDDVEIVESNKVTRQELHSFGRICDVTLAMKYTSNRCHFITK